MPSAIRRTGLICIVALIFAGSAPQARADDYASGDAGHPLRIAAYVLHPIGWMIDFLIMQPAHKIGNSRPLQKFFGHRDDYPETESYRIVVPEPTGPLDPDADSEI
jgi:hypothetical protein